MVALKLIGRVGGEGFSESKGGQGGRGQGFWLVREWIMERKQID